MASQLVAKRIAKFAPLVNSSISVSELMVMTRTTIPVPMAVKSIKITEAVGAVAILSLAESISRMMAIISVLTTESIDAMAVRSVQATEPISAMAVMSIKSTESIAVVALLHI